jgi:hypothetical protein
LATLSLKSTLKTTALAPVGLASSRVIVAVGASVSTVLTDWVATALMFPALSSATLAATSTVMSEVLLAAGLTTSVYSVAETVAKVPLPPPVTLISSDVKPETSSLKVKV